MGRLFVVAAAIAIAFVEGFFYSRIGVGGVESLTIGDAAIGAEQILFIWGFVLVMCLFAFGDACVESGIALVKGSAMAAYSKGLKEQRRETEALRKDSKSLQMLVDAVRQQAASAREDLKIGDQAGPLRTTLEGLRDELRRVRDEEVSVNNKEFGTSRSDIQGLADRTMMWCLLSMFAALASWIAGAMALGSMFPSWPGLLTVITAMGTTLLMGVIGLSLRPGDRYLLQTGGALVSVLPDRSTRGMTIVRVVATFATLAAVPLIASRLASSALAAWMLSLAAGAALMLTARELSRSFFVIGALSRRLFGYLSAAPVAGLAMLLYLNAAAATAVWWVARVVAEPATALFRSVRPRAGEPDTLGAHL
jgi:hypothetical protein